MLKRYAEASQTIVDFNKSLVDDGGAAIQSSVASARTGVGIAATVTAGVEMSAGALLPQAAPSAQAEAIDAR